MNERTSLPTDYYAINGERYYQAGLFFVRRNKNGLEVTVNSQARAQRAWIRRGRELRLHEKKDEPTRMERTAQRLSEGRLPARMVGRAVAAAALLVDPRVMRRDMQRLEDMQDGKFAAAARRIHEQKMLELSLSEQIAAKATDRDRTIVVTHQQPQLEPGTTFIEYDGRKVSAEDLQWCMQRIQCGHDTPAPVTPAGVVEAMVDDVTDDTQKLGTRLEALYDPLLDLSYAQQRQVEGVPGAGYKMMQSMARLIEVYADEQDVQKEGNRASSDDAMHAIYPLADRE